MRYTRAELLGIIAARHGQVEGMGEGAFLDFRIRATPELLESVMGGYFITADGRRTRLDAFSIDSDGLAYPEFVVEVPA